MKLRGKVKRRNQMWDQKAKGSSANWREQEYSPGVNPSHTVNWQWLAHRRSPPGLKVSSSRCQICTRVGQYLHTGTESSQHFADSSPLFCSLDYSNLVTHLQNIKSYVCWVSHLILSWRANQRPCFLLSRECAGFPFSSLKSPTGRLQKLTCRTPTIIAVDFFFPLNF